MLSRLLREVLFALLHCFLTLCELLAKFHEHLSIWWSPKEFPGCDAEYIARSVEALKRRPQHLVILTEGTWLETKELADLALWSLHARIPYISFYDADGTLKPKETELFSEVEKRKCGVPGCIKWSQRSDLNGYSNGHKPFTSTINIFTRRDGKDRIAHLVRDLIQNKVSCSRKEDHYSVDEIDPVLRLYYADIPDPDVIMFCGPLCMTRGLLPWQIRLAEFIPLRKHKALRVQDFVHALRKYSKCDQSLVNTLLKRTHVPKSEVTLRAVVGSALNRFLDRLTCRQIGAIINIIKIWNGGPDIQGQFAVGMNCYVCTEIGVISLSDRVVCRVTPDFIPTTNASISDLNLGV